MGKRRSSGRLQLTSDPVEEAVETEVEFDFEVRDENYSQQMENDSEEELDHAEFIQKRLNQVRDVKSEMNQHSLSNFPFFRLIVSWLRLKRESKYLVILQLILNSNFVVVQFFPWN